MYKLAIKLTYNYSVLTMQNTTTATKINTANANTSKYPLTPSVTSTVFMLADENYAEEWGTTEHPVHIIAQMVTIYNRHYEAHDDLWNDDAAVQAFVEEVEEHKDLVDYINNVALQDAEFVYNCLCGSGL